MSDTVAGTASPAALRPRKATATDLPDVTDTLALAFYDDPVVMWCIDDGSRRRQLLPGFFGAVAESYLSYDETYSVDEGVSAAVWAPPGAKDDEELPTVLGEVVEEYAERLSRSSGSWRRSTRWSRTTTTSYSARGRNGKGAGSGRPSWLRCSRRAIETACRRISRPRASATSSSTFGTASK